MNRHDRAFARLRQANPEPTRTIEDKPTAHEMLAAVRRPPSPQRPRWRRGLLVTAATAVVLLVVAVPVLLFLDIGRDGSPALTEPLSTAAATSVPPTTLATTSTLPTTQPARLGAATQRLVDTFVATYNDGDVDAFAAFLHPDFRREITRERSLEPEPLDTVLTLYEVDAALNTEITLDCTRGTEAVICELTRFDDLHRVLGIEPTEDRRWFLTFEGGQLAIWGETRQNAATTYEAEAMVPFLEWVRANRNVRELFPFTDGVWVVREGIAAEIAALVADWAADVGVTLEG